MASGEVGEKPKLEEKALHEGVSMAGTDWDMSSLLPTRWDFRTSKLARI
jgi:hypothetical protein